MKKDVFKVELARFKNDNVRESTEMLLEMLPDYFYEIPASSTGKHHPACSLGEGGLVRHVKVAMRTLEEILDDSVFGEFDDYTKDLMRMAVLLHDGYKSGLTNSGKTIPNHPNIMSNFLLDCLDKLSITVEEALFVASLIRSHMGPWNKDKDGKVILPVPRTKEAVIVHLCDYIASREFLNVTFEENEIVDSVDRRIYLKK